MDNDRWIEDLAINLDRVLELPTRVGFHPPGPVVLAVIVILLKRTLVVEPNVKVLARSVANPLDLIPLSRRNVSLVLIYGRRIPGIVAYLNRNLSGSLSTRCTHH